MTEPFFPNVVALRYEGPDSDNPLAFRYYDPTRVVLGKTMQEHLRFAVCYWHSLCWPGSDVFGAGTFDRPWLEASDPIAGAEAKARAAFELFHKLGVPFFTFHDRDLAPEGESWNETQSNLDRLVDFAGRQMEQSGVGLLWGTANLFGHPRYAAGAATNPNPEVFACAAAQVKAALEATHALGGANYVLWGGREGYETLLNTNLSRELDQLGRFLSLVVDHKEKIGFEGTLLIEPKPMEPTKHQYDFDTGNVYAFLQRYRLEKQFKVNIEANHAELAGHSFQHELAYAISNAIFGSVDINTGDPQLGWDTDQFPTDVRSAALTMYTIVQGGGLGSGGLNFDAKLRRQSLDREDLFHGHVGGMDTMARGLLIAADLIESGALSDPLEQRYLQWSGPLGRDIDGGNASLESLSSQVLEHNLQPRPVSGRQELLENLLNRYIK